MRAIIYSTLNTAIIDNNSLAVLNNNVINYIGSGPFVEPESKPFSYIIKHPTLNKWALFSTPQIDEFLNKESVELDLTWFNQEI